MPFKIVQAWFLGSWMSRNEEQKREVRRLENRIVGSLLGTNFDPVFYSSS